MDVQKLLIWEVQEQICFTKGKNMVSRKGENNFCSMNRVSEWFGGGLSNLIMIFFVLESVNIKIILTPDTFFPAFVSFIQLLIRRKRNHFQNTRTEKEII
jgi:hypothetical protein